MFKEHLPVKKKTTPQEIYKKLKQFTSTRGTGKNWKYTQCPPTEWMNAL